MILFATTFNFDEVLQMQPGKDNMVRHELVDQAWLRWASEDPASYVKYDEVAQGTIEVASAGYTVWIETEKEKHETRSNDACDDYEETMPVTITRKGEDFPWEDETIVVLKCAGENKVSLCLRHPDLDHDVTFTCQAVELLRAVNTLTEAL